MKPRLLFIKHKEFNARTVDNDIQILQDAYDIRMYEVNTAKGLSFFTALIKQFFFLFFNIYKYRIVFIWFADYHSFLPVFFAKLSGGFSAVNIGGYDADEILIREPESLKAKFRKFCVSYTVKKCTKLFPVSDVIKSYLERVVPSGKSETMYCCVNTDKFNTDEKTGKKENLVITVGGGGEFVKEAKRKRLDFFIELGEEFSKRYPEFNAKFFLIGHDEGTNTYSYLKELIKSSSIEIKPMTKSIDELVSYYRRASVYMQLSFYEAFGIAQIEAMLYGCIPVSNPGGAVPEVIGNAGFMVEDYDMEKYIEYIKEIFEGKHEELRNEARKRVLEKFTLSIRKEKLLNALPR